jgi:ABC-type uncharacterized transport system
MDEHAIDIVQLLWASGWLLAVVALFWVGLRLPLDIRLTHWNGRFYAAAVVIAAIGACVLANVALVLHDGHFDLTREKVYTPSAAALRMVDALDRDVVVTWFYQGQDPIARRTRDILQIMQRRNPRFRLATVDPDKEPTLARTQGIRIYNAAMIEADGRRVLVQSTDEADIALGVQRVLRERVITVCFLEGHGELPMDNFEFHTHLEGLTDHSHGDASSAVVEVAGHGVGRFRRALEAQGYGARQVILATRREVPADCTLVVSASPWTTFLPAESAALRTYLQHGGSALFLFDLGYALEPSHELLLADLNVRLEPEIVIDPLSHYQTDPQMVAVTGYEPHPITQSVSLTFFPGVRPMTPLAQSARLNVAPLLTSSRDSYVRPVAMLDTRLAGSARPKTDSGPALPGTASPVAGPRVLGVVAEGWIEGSSQPLRVVVIGDGDFASNSFFPYMSNSDMLLSAVRWLAREERSTAIASRMPVPQFVLLTAPQTRLVFSVVVILLPLSVILCGCVIWWRRR